MPYSLDRLRTLALEGEASHAEEEQKPARRLWDSRCRESAAASCSKRRERDPCCCTSRRRIKYIRGLDGVIVDDPVFRAVSDVTINDYENEIIPGGNASCFTACGGASICADNTITGS